MWRRRAEASTRLTEVIPSQWDDEPGLRSRDMLAALSGREPLALEFAARPGETRFLLRAWSDEAMDAALDQFRAAYPQAGIKRLAVDGRPYLDPCRAGPGEDYRGVSLCLTRPSAYPLDTDARHGDPFKGVLAAASAVGMGERLVGQVMLHPAPPMWSERLRSRTEAQAAARKAGSQSQTSTSILPVIGLLGLAGIASQAYQWYQEGETLLLAASGVSVTIGLPLLGVMARKLMGGSGEIPAQLVNEKLAYPLFRISLRILAFGPEGVPPARLLSLCNRVGAAFQAYEHAQGNAFLSRGLKKGRSGDLSPGLPGRDILNAAEVATLWHLPNTAAGASFHPNTSAHHLLPAPDDVGRGGRIGVSRHQETEVPVSLPPDMLHRNQLIVAKTRRGKSTLLVHQATHVMRRMVEQRERLLLVVVDPHQDLAEAVLGQVPDVLEDRVVYLNLADREHPIGLNLLDVDLFPDRERVVENVITMMNRLWPDNWGPRMEQALRSSLLCLYSASLNPEVEDRFTLLDVLPMLANEGFRRSIRKLVDEPALWVSWRDNYESLNRVLQQQIANPVNTKIGRFLVAESTRFVIGQPSSTWDPRPLLKDGGVLVVNSAVGILGEGAAALLGATILNLLAALVEEQVALPPSQRTRMIALVDESSTLGAADYPRMLSELGKYGASFTLVTQSLSKLDAIDDALRPTLFANIDALTAFQTSAQDARYLSPELGGDIDIADLVALDDYECYARWSAGGRKLPPFSLRLDPPRRADRAKVARIAERSALRYGRPRDDVSEEVTAILLSREPPQPPKTVRKEEGKQAAKTDDTPVAPQPAAADPAIPRHVRNQNRNHNKEVANVPSQ